MSNACKLTLATSLALNNSFKYVQIHTIFEQALLELGGVKLRSKKVFLSLLSF